MIFDTLKFFQFRSDSRKLLKRCGKPVAFYSDKHGIFRVNQTSSGYEDTITQFGRSMRELDIQIIYANIPQAKGRVERASQTLQDRLPKKMRLLEISTREAGNAYLPEFIADFNQRFAEDSKSVADTRRPLTDKDNLSHILSWQEPRRFKKT